MNEKNIKTLLERDNNLREAVNRREQNLPSMPSDLNARLMQRMGQSDEQPKRRIWLYVVSGVAASILLLLAFHFWQKTTEEAPQSVVAKHDPPKKEIKVKEPEVVKEKRVAMVEEPKPVQEVVPQKKVVAKVSKKQEVVEEEGNENVQELSIAYVEYEDVRVEEYVEEHRVSPPPSGVEELEDPYAYTMNQIRDIRTRGERLQREVAMVVK